MIARLAKRLGEFIAAARRSEVVRRSIRNATFSSWEYLVLPVLTLAATPVYLATLGVEKYGIWMLANSIGGFSGLFGFGLTDATIRYVVKYRSLDDEDGVVRVLGTTAVMYGVLGVFAASIGIAAAPWLVGSVFSVPASNADIAVGALRVAFVGIGARFADGVASAGLQGFERFDLSSRISIVVNVLAVGATVSAALAGVDVVGLISIMLTSLVVGALAKVYVLRARLVPSLGLFPRFDMATLREVLAFGLYSWVQGIGGVLFNQADRLVVAAVLGTTALGYYSVALQVGRQIHALLAKAASFVFPLAGATFEKGDERMLVRTYVLATRATVAASVGIGLPLLVLAPDLLTLWVGPDVAAQATTPLRILVIGTTLAATSIVPFYYMNATGMLRLNTAFGLLGGLVSAVVALITTTTFGLVGAAWSRSANVPTDLVARWLLHRQILNDDRWHASLVLYVPSVIVYGLALPFVLGHTEAAFGIVVTLGGLAALGVFGLGVGAALAWLTIRARAGSRPRSERTA